MLKLIFFSVVLFSSNAMALDSIEVFVANELLSEKGKQFFDIDKLKNSTRAKVTVYNVQALSNAEDHLSEGLPSNENQALHIVRQRMASKKYRSTLMEIENAVPSIMKLATYQIEKIPAFVFDNEYVVYGVTPLQALSEYQSFIKKGTSNDK
ncbi:hypothetical protein UA38_11725 [Photobacterium kishitanii]|nr:DUF1525 domain-containing protein [Photobacterium kishitanii]KJG57037.1 hypothetical protein UA38_11725 [Photobacterium kishitanii]KJG60561.1 hypothetical protein UA42_14510 [Photobacterium kishitanii]KJG64863.1 hypothetical protein UA40_14205 [Photobacterium kishitanii]KJG68500.1 hypothetical protein UA41_16620 [Photobacterium kishitanii]OBU31216.1 hypothetical protein AYY23_20095 [Photobacterium kishitanii]